MMKYLSIFNRYFLLPAYIGICTLYPNNSEKVFAQNDPSSETPVSIQASKFIPQFVRPALSKKSYPKYHRSFFGRAWTDDNTAFLGHNGCDTRDDILHMQAIGMVEFVTDSGCKVKSTTIYDPYKGDKIRYVRQRNNGVDVDHIVPLAVAFRTGAQDLSFSQRVNLANDPLNLVATSSRLNRQKGDAPIDAWLPSNKAFRCEYAKRYIVVKRKYHLWFTPSEARFLSRFIPSCQKVDKLCIKA